MNRLSISCACLSLFLVSAPGLAQSPTDSLTRASRGGPTMAPDRTAVMARINLEPRRRSAAPDVAELSSAEREHILASAATGLAIGVIGLTVRNLARGEGRARNAGTDLEI